MVTEQGKTRQEGQPKSLFDVLVATTVTEFNSKEFFIEGGHETGYTLWFAAADAVKKALKTGRTSLEIFDELAKKSKVAPTDINNLGAVGNLNPKTWGEYLDMTSELILEKLVSGFRPDLSKESIRRFNHYV